ncbi:hypothetical protein [Curtobacterium sp. AB7]|uniref:hypothetical protein n=1 Tax=Curtobacterium sp. AB7 TaxID=3349327 RepID=UPI003839472E
MLRELTATRAVDHVGGFVRTLLHAPRTRKRSIAAATLGALALVGSLLVATPAQAINDTGTGGVFVPATGRVLDTKNGVGGYSTPMEAGKYRTIKIAGLAGIPDDGSVGAVSLNATVGGTADNGTLFGRPNADTSRTMMLVYNDNTGEYVSNSAIVAVNSDGTIQVATETASRLILDVQGYYTSGEDGTAAGGFVPVAGKRIVDTRSGLGAPKAVLTPGSSIDVQVAGQNGVPANASAAVVNLVPISTGTTDGYLTPYPTGGTVPKNSLHYAPSTNTSIQAQVQLSSSGKMTIANPSGTANLVVDLQGYFTAAGTAGATFTPGIGRVYNSTASGEAALAANETRSIQISGKAGLPVMGSGINAVVLTLTAYHAGSDGRAAVWADGAAKPDTTSINFRAGEIRTNTVTVPLGSNGKISLNNVASATNYLIDVQGWYSDPSVAAITCPAPYTDGSWTGATPASVTCTVVAPPATGTGEYVEISTPAGIQDVPLSASSSTRTAVKFAPVAGENDIYATLVDQAENVVNENSYSLGFGDWSKTPLALTPAPAATSTLPLSLLALPGDGATFFDDAAVVYTVSSNADMSSPLWTSSQSATGTTVPNGVLVDGGTYYWTAAVRGSTDWFGTQASVVTGAQRVTINDQAAALTSDQINGIRDQMSQLGIASSDQDSLIQKISTGQALDSSDPDAVPVQTLAETSEDGQTTTTKVFADGSRSSVTEASAEVVSPQGVQARYAKPALSGCKSSAGWKVNCKVEIRDPYSNAFFILDYQTSSKGKAKVRDVRQKTCHNWIGGCSVWGGIKRKTQSSAGPAWAEVSFKADILKLGQVGQGAFGIRVTKTATTY